MAQLYTNNALGKLLTGVGTGDTTLTLEAGQGALFAAPSGGDYQIVTLCDNLETVFEMVRVTARTGDTLTVTRAQEGSSAQTWGVGTKVYSSLTAALMAKLARKDETQTISAAWNFTVAPTINGNNVWHTGNMGEGSGLDADILDGQHGAYYRNVSNMNAGTLATARGGTGLTTFTANSYVRAASSSALEFRTPAQVLSDIGGAANTIQVIAGNGLTGGGDLTANRTITLGTPTSVGVTSTNSVTSTSHTHLFANYYSTADDVAAASTYPADMVSFGNMSSSVATGGIANHLTMRGNSDNRVVQIVTSVAGGSTTPVMYFRTSHTTTGGGGWTAYQTLANDGNVVHRTGNESISGIKTFNSLLISAGIQAPSNAIDWRINIASLVNEDYMQMRLVSGGSFSTTRGAILELNGANAASNAGAWRLLSVTDSILQSTNSLTISTTLAQFSGNVGVTGSLTVTAGATFNAPATINHTSGTGLVVNRSGSANNSNIQFQNTSGSVYVGLTGSPALYVGGSADLTTAANRWFTVTSANAYVVLSGVANGVWHSGNFDPTLKADLSNTMSQKGLIGDAVNLDSYGSTGIWHQNLNAQAATGSNYPAALAGRLEVLASGSFLYQTYTAYQNNSMYRRSWYSTAWSPWRMIWDSGNFNPGDYVDRSTAQSVAGNKTFTGNSIFDFGGGTTNTNSPLVAQNGGNYRMSFYPRLPATSYNPSVVANDSALIFTAGSSGTGRLFIGPWGTTGSGLAMNDGSVAVYGPAFHTQGPMSVNRIGSIVGALDILAATNCRFIFRTGSSSGTLDTVNAANSAYVPMEMRATSFSLNGGALVVNDGAITTATWIASGTYISAGTVLIAASGDGNGLRLWGDTGGPYSIFMSSSGNGTWGGRPAGETTSDYNMYFRMTGGTNRGFVFQNGATNVAGIDGSGTFRGNWIYGVQVHATDWFRSTGGGGWYSQTYGGGIHMTDSTYVRIYNNKHLAVDSGEIHFGSTTRQMLNCYTTTYGIGVQSATLYFRAGASGGFAWHVGGVHSNTQNDPGSGGALRGRLDTNGNWVGTDFYATSDERKKMAIEDATFTARIRPRTWIWKTGTARAGKFDFGVVAQELEVIYPWAVNTDPDGFKDVAYGKLAVIVAAQLYDFEDKVEVELTQLRNRVAMLEAKLQTYGGL